MKNYLQNGHIVRVTTPAGGIASGDALIVGSIFGIAVNRRSKLTPYRRAILTPLSDCLSTARAGAAARIHALAAAPAGVAV